MKLSTALLVVAALAHSALANVVAPRATCNADNCARAVTGTANTRIPKESRLADCRTFMVITVPALTTVYVSFPAQDLAVSLSLLLPFLCWDYG
jgi:Mn2+/Fe2+ NRAMP family transporter